MYFIAEKKSSQSPGPSTRVRFDRMSRLNSQPGAPITTLHDGTFSFIDVNIFVTICTTICNKHATRI